MLRSAPELSTSSDSDDEWLRVLCNSKRSPSPPEKFMIGMMRAYSRDNYSSAGEHHRPATQNASPRTSNPHPFADGPCNAFAEVEGGMPWVQAAQRAVAAPPPGGQGWNTGARHCLGNLSYGQVGIWPCRAMQSSPAAPLQAVLSCPLQLRWYLGSSSSRWSISVSLSVHGSRIAGWRASCQGWSGWTGRWTCTEDIFNIMILVQGALRTYSLPAKEARVISVTFTRRMLDDWIDPEWEIVDAPQN